MKKIILIISIFFISINNLSAREIVAFNTCIDGDTFKIIKDNQEYTIRLLAVDTPESVHPTKDIEYYSKEASIYTCNILKNAKIIELEFDDKSTKEDKYGRLLAWVYVDNKLLQELLIENGYAKLAYLYDDYKYIEYLKNIQEKSSNKGIGIWNETAKENYNSKEEHHFYLEISIIIISLIIIYLFNKKKISKYIHKKVIS